MIESDDVIVVAGKEPEVEALINEFMACAPTDTGGWNRSTVNEATRLAVWRGMSPDGKKRGEWLGEDAFPFEGASDTRILMADEVIGEQVATLVVAFFRAAMQQKMSLDPERGLVLRLVEHLLNKTLVDDLADQVELSAQYMGTYGWYLLHTRWAKEIRLERKLVSLEQLQQTVAGYAQQSGQDPQAALAGFMGMLMDDSRDQETGEVLNGLHAMYAAQVLAQEDIEVPPLSGATLRRAVKELRLEGKTELPVPYVCRDEPEVLAKKPWDEVFIHGDVTDIRKARVFDRVFMTEVELREKIVTEKWDAKWVEEALKHKGEVSVWAAGSGELGAWSKEGGSGRGRTMEEGAALVGYGTRDSKSALVEVLYCTYWAVDGDGIPGLYSTVLHVNVKGQWATHGLAEAGEAYVAGRREKIAPQITSSRGVPEVVIGWQREKKGQRDASMDLASIGVMPPLHKYDTALGTKFRFGPGVQNTVKPGREPKFMEIPKSGAPLADRIQQLIDGDVDSYFGRFGEKVSPVVSQTRQQMMVNNFFGTWVRAISNLVGLWRIHGSDAEFSAITGAPQGWFDANRERKDLWGRPTELAMDVRELDPEFAMQQMKLLNEVVVPGDSTGALDRRQMTMVQLSAINPLLARRLVRDETAASQAMFDEVSNQVALMYLGNVPKMVEMDPTAATKLQYSLEIVRKNPKYQQALRDDARFGKLMEGYAKNLQFSITQEKNKQVGRIGVDPAELDAGSGEQA